MGDSLITYNLHTLHSAVPPSLPVLCTLTAKCVWLFCSFLQATQNPFYLHVGRDILNSLEKYTKTRCVHNSTLYKKGDGLQWNLFNADTLGTNQYRGNSLGAFATILWLRPRVVAFSTSGIFLVYLISKVFWFQEMYYVYVHKQGVWDRESVLFV